MTAENIPTTPRGRIVLAAMIFLAGLSALMWCYWDRYGLVEVHAAEPSKPVPPQELFKTWPKDGDKVRKPDFAIIVTGQTYGYLQKCGCSNPQKGGLERRYNFIEKLKADGWEVVGLDVGDVLKPLPYTPSDQQTLTKYEYAMKAMQIMGYQGVGIGREELSAGLLNTIQQYSLQKGNESPKLMLANVDNPNDFPNLSGGSSLVESDVITSKNGINVGVMGIIGAELQTSVIDRSVRFSPQAANVVTKVLGDWDKAKQQPALRVMLYNGPLEWTDPTTNRQSDAMTVAKFFPQFQVIVCLTKDTEAPDIPKIVNDNKTMIVQVGHRGQNVGVIGVYKIDNSIQFFYQRVTMADEFETPADKADSNKMLKHLQDYADTVKNNDYLSMMADRKKRHPMQIEFPEAKFVGDRQCIECHKAEHTLWEGSKHSHAFEALEKYAKKPSGRHFDGECIICHTVGYDYKTGYLNEKTTPQLKNVQCESCHGPASLHVAEATVNLTSKKPTSKYLKMLSPWKAGTDAMLPNKEKFAAMAAEKDDVKREAMMTQSEKLAYQGVYQICAKCHDIDNDPKFQLYEYWPKIVHTGFGKKKK